MRLPPLLTLAALCLSLTSTAEPPKSTAPPKAPARAQRKSRLDLASSGWSQALGRYKAGAVGIEELVRWSQWLFDAERVADPKGAVSHRLTRLGELEDTVSGRINAGSATQLDLFAVQYLLATAQSE